MGRKTTKTYQPSKSPSLGDSRNSKIRVRMYRVGFGDCFLVAFPVLGGQKYVLVDCGVHARGDIHTMQQVVADIGEVTGGKLAILIATHAHQDHISGFGSMESQFRKFLIGEVWLPWTENPKDTDAAKLRKKRMALVASLQAHFSAVAPNSPAADAMANIAVDQRAMDALHSGFGVAAKVRYIEAGQDDLEAPGDITGLTVKPLGPPRSPEFLAKMDPPAGQHYLCLDEKGRIVPADTLRPFRDRWRVKEGADGAPVAEDSEALNERADTPLDSLAFAVDQALNNTSLVALFRFAGKNLLFAGDAQFGNWKAWLDEKNSDEILQQLDFYKVAHHGSVNATPKAALEKMGHGDLAAMVSTQSVPWPSIPAGKLMGALERRTQHAVVRSDSLAVAAAPKAPRGPQLGKLPEGFSSGPLFYEYVIS